MKIPKIKIGNISKCNAKLLSPEELENIFEKPKMLKRKNLFNYEQGKLFKFLMEKKG